MWDNRFFILLMSISALFSCSAEQDKEENYQRILKYWETRTKSALYSCDDSLATNKAKKTFNLIETFNLRSRVLREVFEFTDFSAETHLVEANDGDPNTYSVYVTTPSIDSSIYVVHFKKASDTFQVNRVLKSDKEFSWYRPYFDGWTDYVDSVTEDQKVFLCGSKDLQYETIFRLTFSPP
jgi:hypothetical protein